MKISLCILTRNEADCLTKTLKPLAQYLKNNNLFDRVTVIDGNSTDGTVEMFQNHNIEVLNQIGRGRGAAFHTAFKLLDSDAWIFYSPDGNEDIEDLPKFIEALKNNYDIVIASRMMKDAFNEEDIYYWKPRKWANNLFNFAANLFFRSEGHFVTDSINGYRAITKNAVQKLQLDALDYTIEYQMTIRAMKRRLSVFEFPTIEGQRIAGDESPSFVLGVRFLQCFWRELFYKK